MKNKWVNWLTKTVLDIELTDEYQAKEINYILKIGFILFFWYLTLTIVIGPLLFFILPIQMLFLGLLIGNLLILLVVVTLVNQMIKKRKLDLVDAYDQDDYQHLIYKLKVNSVKRGIFFFAVERLFSILLDWETKTAHQTISQIVLDPFKNFFGLVCAITFGVCMYYSRRNKIQK